MVVGDRGNRRGLTVHAEDLYANPLAYPGVPIARSGVLTPDGMRTTDPDELATLVSDRDRTPMLAIGSNASPGQLRRKLGQRAVVPMARVTVRDLRPGVSAHVSRAGYLPATPVEVAGATARLTMLWLDERQLAALDETEPNYDRITVPVDRYPLTLDIDHRPGAYDLYVSRHGWLVDGTGDPRRLESQPALIRTLLRQSPALAALAGPTPETFVATMRAETAREQVRLIFVAEDLVERQATS